MCLTQHYFYYLPHLYQTNLTQIKIKIKKIAKLCIESEAETNEDELNLLLSSAKKGDYNAVDDDDDDNDFDNKNFNININNSSSSSAQKFIFPGSETIKKGI